MSFSWQPEALMQNFETSAYCQPFEVSSTDQYNVRPEFLTPRGDWYAYAADPLVLLVNQERLNEKRFCVLTNGPIFLQMACVEGVLFLTRTYVYGQEV